MKRKNFTKSLVAVAVFLLVGVMVATGAITSFTASAVSGKTQNSSGSAIISQSNTGADLSEIINPENLVEDTNSLKAGDEIGFIIEMEEESLMDSYFKDNKGYSSYKEYLLSPYGKTAAENLKRKQYALYNKIARVVDTEFAFSYVSAMNGFAINIKYGDREAVDEIAYGAKVHNTLISERYEAPQATVVENEVVAYDTGIFDSQSSFDLGYAGEGMIVAVLDTGLDYTHKAFSTDTVEGTQLALTSREVEALAPYLSASSISNNLTVSDVYINEKVPFGYDYADFDTDVNTHIDNMHGTHVAGIIAGLSEEPKDANGNYYKDKQGKDITGITGVAPKAQLAIMKVFSDFEGGAESISLLGALEDCIVLGVDVINMSLGSDSGFQDDTDSKDSIFNVYERVGDAGISLVVAASNSYSSGFSTHDGLNLTSNPDSGTVGSPSTYDASFSVASISGVKSKYLLATDTQGNEYGVAYFHEAAHTNGESYDFIADLTQAIKDKGLTQYITTNASGNEIITIPYVTIAGIGQSANYAGKDVSGKIALVRRGSSTFEEKIKIARDKGAIACIIYNNVAGVIRMSVGDEINLPACSVSMDAAATFANKNGQFVIDATSLAGPFMSDFSSWGPLPNLLLKPEITAHGGEIYSAEPGDGYARISGTSMACPNMAGVVALMRQYMKTPENARKFGLLDARGNLDLNEMETRIYQILMSTATIANNEEGNPYSPRKQGSGLASLQNAQIAEQYIYVTETEKTLDADGNVIDTTEVIKDRTKIELLDDPDKTGVYELNFHVKNVGSTAVTYDVSASVFTEGVSTDGKTVTEKAYMLTSNNQVVTVGGNVATDKVITVPAGGDVEVNITITLSSSEKAYLDANFKNGMYVEGYAMLKNRADGGLNLNCPYLAFYGDWAAAPMRDYDIYETSADEVNDAINEDDKRYSNTRPTNMYAKVVQSGSEYVFGMGQFVFYVPDEFDQPAVEKDHNALSFNPEGMANLYCVGGFLRGAKKVFYTITDDFTGDVLVDDVYYNARKAGGASGLGGAWLDMDISDIGVINNGRYRIDIYTVLDWDADQYQTKDDVPEENKWSSYFWVDSEAPMILDSEIRTTYDRNDNPTRYLDFYIYDNHYASAISFELMNPKTGEFESYYSPNADGTSGLRPISSSRNGTTRVTYNITNYWEDIVDTNYEAEVMIYDYAFNVNYYKLDLKELLVPMESVDFGDFGEYEEYSDGTHSINIIRDFTDERNRPADGSYDSLTMLTMIPGQTINLRKSLVVTPSTAWREDYHWEVSNASAGVLKINEETGEIIALKSGTAKVTIRSITNPLVSKSINISVLSEADVQSYGISSKLVGKQTLSRLEFEKSYQYLNAGEEYEISIKLDPWYLDTDKYEIRWESLSSLVATVEVDPNNSYKAIVKANSSSYDANGAYQSNISGSANIRAVAYEKDTQKETIYSAQFTAIVYKEFVVEGNSLTEWHGVGGEVVIPDNLNITTIDSRVFVNNKTITKLVFPEGVETIGYAACAYMTNLHTVVLPSTVQTIDGYAFAARVEPGENPYMANTMLSIVDTSACKKPIYAGRQAFSCQIYLGYDTYQTPRDVDYVDGAGTAVRADVQMDLSMFRNLGDLAFYWCAGLANINFTGLASVRTASLFAAGYSAYAYGDPVTLTFGETTSIEGVQSFTNVFCTEIVYHGSRVGQQAFAGNMTLNKLTFTSDNVVIEDAAFMDCSAISSITFEQDVEYIGAQAFYNSRARSLVELKFEGNCKEIGLGAFAGNGLSELDLPNGLEKLGDMAFYFSPNLTKVNINSTTNLTHFEFGADQSLTALLGNVFYGCEKFAAFGMVTDSLGHEVQNASLAVEDGILYNRNKTSIVAIPFGKSLNNFTLLPSITAIAPYAFSGNTTLTAIDLSQVNKVGEGAFMSCTNLESVTFSPNMTVVEPLTFGGCSSLAEIDFNGAQLTSIGDFAFGTNYLNDANESGCAIEEMVLPETVEYIGTGAFAKCANLVSINIPSSITEILPYTFYSCRSLTNVGLTQNVEIIHPYAFVLTAISRLSGTGVIGITAIGRSAFDACFNLETINLPNVEYIGPSAFRPAVTGSGTSVPTLTSVSFGGRMSVLSTIDAQAFYGQSKITKIDLYSVQYVGNMAFYGCTGIQSITNYNNLMYIGGQSFAGVAVTSFEVPAECVYIDPTAFSQSMIAGYTVNSDNPYYFADENGVLYRNIEDGYELVSYPYNKGNMVEYDILDGTVKVAGYAFLGNSVLRTINFPASVEVIGDMAFYGSSSIAVYNFHGLTAPELEASTAMIDLSQYFENGQDTYYYQVYANFYQPFNFTVSSSGVNPFRYITFGLSDPTDIDTGLQNTTFTGMGNPAYYFRLVLMYPANATGFDSFVWQGYFDGIYETSEVIEEVTQNVLDSIIALPDARTITADYSDDLQEIRSNYNMIASYVQRQFIIDAGMLEKLEACEKAMANLVPSESNMSVDAIKARALIEALPDAANITVADRVYVEKARAAIDAIIDATQLTLLANDVAKLAACEGKLGEIGSTTVGEAATKARVLIEALPDAANITLSDKAYVEKARAAYDAVTNEAEIAQLAAQKEKLEACEAKLAELEENNGGCACGTITGTNSWFIGGMMIIALAFALAIVLSKKRQKVSR